MPRITEIKLTWAFGLTLLILAGNALISYSDLIEQAQNTPLVVRSRQVLDQIAAVDSVIKDAESSRRGFLIDGNLPDLAAFGRAADEITAGTAALLALTKEHPDQLARVEELDRAARAYLAELRGSVVRAQLEGEHRAREAFDLDPVRRHLARLRAQIEAIDAAESSYLSARVEERRVGIARAFVTFSVASTLALITIGTTYALVRRYFADRNKAERILQESEARIRLLFDSVGEGIYGIDNQGRCTFCNPSALRLLGFDLVEQLLGRDMHRLVHHTRPDGSPFPAHLCPIYRTFHTGEGVLGVEDFFYRADGEPIPVEYRAHAIRRDGEILGAVVTFVDIAPKRRAETEMRFRDRALRAIGQGVVIIDPTQATHPIVYANAAFERLTGHGPRDWAGRSFEILGDGEVTAEVAELHAAIRERRAAAVEMLARRKDGTPFWNSLTLDPVEGQHGAVVHFVGVLTDISERRQQEQTLRTSEERLRLMVESVRDYAIFSIDLAGRVSSWNSGAERLYGYVDRQILAQPAETLFTDEDRRAGIPEAELAEAGRAGRAEEERWHLRRDGTRFLASGMVTAVLDEVGNLLGYTKVTRDITEPKRVETELRTAKEAAESAVRAKSTFLANMGHEFRTPLNAIIGYSEMLADEAIDRGVDEFLPDLERIKESGRVLLKLVNNVLDLSRIEAGGMTLNEEPFDLGDMIRGVVRTVEPLAEQRGNVVQVEYPNDLGSLSADFAKLNQALVHLLSNAVKFTESGTIIFRVGLDRVVDDRPWLVFSVIDDGIGMTRDETARLFEPFVQADDSPARRFGGTGLGLTIAHRFCRMMGGRIEVASEPGRGTTFRMALPVRRDDQVTTLKPSSAAHPELGPPDDAVELVG